MVAPTLTKNGTHLTQDNE